MSKSIDRATARQVIEWLHQISAAGRLPDLFEAIGYARREFRDERNNRTSGEVLHYGELADIAAQLLGVDRRLCDEAVADLLGWPQVAIEVIQAEAERLTPRRPSPVQPLRRRRNVA
jgi:hypothetical protein